MPTELPVRTDWARLLELLKDLAKLKLARYRLQLLLWCVRLRK